MTADEMMIRSKAGQISPAELFAWLARNMSRGLTIVHHPDTPGAMPSANTKAILATPYRDSAGNAGAALFTGLEALTDTPVPVSSGFLEAETLWILQTALRSGLKGLVINPGKDSQLGLDEKYLRLLFREYALVALEQAGGAWVPTKDDSLWVVELRPDMRTVPVYLTEADANEICRSSGGTAQLHPWTRVWDRCEEADAEAALLQYDLPEQIGLLPRHLAHLCGDGRVDPLDKLAEVASRSLGSCNAFEMINALAGLKKVWVLADDEGAIISLSKAFDLFTSANEAEAYIGEARRKNPQMPAIHVRTLPAQPLFASLASQRSSVAIDPGSEHAWVGFGDTFPRVLAAAARQAGQRTGAPAAAGQRSWWQRLLSRV